MDNTIKVKLIYDKDMKTINSRLWMQVFLNYWIKHLCWKVEAEKI